MKRNPIHRFDNPSLLIDYPNYLTLSFSYEKIPSNTPFKLPGPNVQYYPSTKKVTPIFNGEFESGNLQKVFKTGPFSYEIHIIPDPSGFAEWFFFSCEQIEPGDYTFVIANFHRQCNNFHRMVSPVAYSIYQSKSKIGWMRIGHSINYWRTSKRPARYNLSFTFTVLQKDTMYFAFLYPYPLTQLYHAISLLPSSICCSVIGKSKGGMNFPAIFWDDDFQYCRDVSKIEKDERGPHKPFILIAARLHPGESNSSYAMEGLMQTLFANTVLLSIFSFFLIPIVNVDGEGIWILSTIFKWN
jgi:hypothetical protein